MLRADLCLSYSGSGDLVQMVLVDIRAPVGFMFIEAEFETMRSAGLINNYEVKDRLCQLYINSVEKGEEVKLTYHLLALKPIKGTIQGVQAYDMYCPELRAEAEPVQIEST